ncbi:hypothetical protein EsH8_III_000991 [Colletotrichum jinshuiense]
MPPPPPNPPLALALSPPVLPYILRFHPHGPSSPPPAEHTRRLCVSAAVMDPSSPAGGQSSAPPRVLLVRRSATEAAVPLKWELPGGSAESADGDSLAAAARELWEETGLRARRAAALVGCYEWAGMTDGDRAVAVPGDQGWGLPGGGVGIVEAARAGAADADADGGGRPPKAAAGGRRDAWRKYTYLFEVETAADGSVRVVLDPEEHDAFVWATEDDVRGDRCGDVQLDWTSQNQKLDVLNAFEVARKKR